MIPRRADVVIIGAGVIGASVAYHLSLKKIGVLLLDKGDPGAGTSGACSGHIFLQSKRPGPHLKLAMESEQRFRTLQEELDFDIEYEGPGGMIVIENEKELEAMHLLMEEQNRFGLPVSLLESDQAREMEPALSEDVMAAAFCPLEGQVNPLRLTLAFIRAAVRMGARIIPRTEVMDMRLEGKRVAAVRTKSGDIETGIVVNAAGPLAPRIGAMVNLQVPIKPRRGQLLVTEAVPRMLHRPLLSAGYITEKYETKDSTSRGTGVSIEQTRNGNLLLGSTREFAGFDRSTTWEGTRHIAHRTARILPELRKTHLIRTFSGLRPHTPDGLPVLGRVEGIDGYLMAAGHEGDGIALSPGTGQRLAELVHVGRTSMDLRDFRLERFHPGDEP